MAKKPLANAVRRVWDACTMCDYLKGADWLKDAAEKIIRQAENGETEILVSTLTRIEIPFLKGIDDGKAEGMIREFFNRRYVIEVNIDTLVVETARELRLKYGPSNQKISVPDYVNLAIAIVHEVPRLETREKGLKGLSGREGNPAVVIEEPRYLGPPTLFDRPFI